MTTTSGKVSANDTNITANNLSIVATALSAANNMVLSISNLFTNQGTIALTLPLVVDILVAVILSLFVAVISPELLSVLTMMFWLLLACSVPANILSIVATALSAANNMVLSISNLFTNQGTIQANQRNIT
jgi:hypothetical protein